MRYGKAHDSHDDEALPHRTDRRLRGQHDGGSRACTAENRPPPHEAFVARFVRAVVVDGEKAGREEAGAEIGRQRELGLELEFVVELEFDDARSERQAGGEKTGSEASAVHEAAITAA